ncbi:hypothetical protein [Dietzia sp. B32]|uniref:Rv1157c family protein n=1 Tax=Dietzia sp. B32 TaxID=2915130 RepID=UPI0021AE297E|nr:hypothetical protein [Dietzia sp. B32]UVE95797.1 hypothetical protein L8M95_03075 [Dietzia sp. B32]
MIRHSLRTSFRTLGLGAVAALAVGLAAPATASAQSLDELGRPTEPVLQAIENLSEQQWIPEDTRGTIARLVGFFRGTGEPGTPLPENGPVIAQFAYPTIMQQCIGGDQTAVGAATAVPGPADLPLPGIDPGKLGFIFTALGTEGVAAQQAQPMTVEWINISNGRRGSTVLTYNGINEGGPATVNGVADTGAGQVLMLLQGGVTTNLEDGGTANCVAFPTVGTAFVR